MNLIVHIFLKLDFTDLEPVNILIYLFTIFI